MPNHSRDSFYKFYHSILTLSPLQYEKEFIYSGYTYGDLLRLAAGIKNGLLRRGNKNILCLCTTNQAVVAACLLASLSGPWKLIFPYSFSPHTLAEVQEVIRFDVAIADHPENMPSGVDVMIPLPADIEDISPEFTRNPDDTFLYLFTGGSTGRPKVWSKTPRNMLAEAFYLKKKFSLSDSDLFVATVPPYHIYGLLFSVLVPLGSGASIMGDIYTFPQEIISTINRYCATILVSVPVHYKVLKTDHLSLPSLRWAFSSAGFLDRSDSLFFYEKTGVGITEIYGSTETGGVATRNIREQTESWQPFDVVAWKFINDRLAVKSDFVSHELEHDEEGFYITGDKARQDRHNRFLLLGRADGVVKVAGKRVDLMDIQNKIKKLPMVSDAVVLHLPTAHGRENIIAAVIACELTEAQLRKLLKETVEPYAMPRRFKIVPAIARNATGKIDRRWLEKLFE